MLWKEVWMDKKEERIMKPSTFDKLKTISIVLGISVAEMIVKFIDEFTGKRLKKWLILLGSVYEDAILELIIACDAQPPSLQPTHNIAYKRILGGGFCDYCGFYLNPHFEFWDNQDASFKFCYNIYIMFKIRGGLKV